MILIGFILNVFSIVYDFNIFIVCKPPWILFSPEKAGCNFFFLNNSGHYQSIHGQPPCLEVGREVQICCTDFPYWGNLTVLVRKQLNSEVGWGWVGNHLCERHDMPEPGHFLFFWRTWGGEANVAGIPADMGSSAEGWLAVWDGWMSSVSFATMKPLNWSENMVACQIIVFQIVDFLRSNWAFRFCLCGGDEHVCSECVCIWTGIEMADCSLSNTNNLWRDRPG